MKNFIRLLKYIKPYKGWLASSVIFMLFFAIFSSVSIWMVAPFLGTLFSVEEVTNIPMDINIATEQDADGTTNTGARSKEDSIQERNKSKVDRTIEEKINRFTQFKTKLKNKVDNYLLADTKIKSLQRICFVFFFLFLLKNIFGYAQNYAMSFITRKIIKNLRDDLFIHFNRLPLSYFHARKGGQLISRVTNDVEVANKAINVSFTNLVRDPVFIMIYLGTAVFISPKLTLIAFTVLPLSMLIIIQIGKKLRKYSTQQQTKMANLTSILQETVNGIRVIKAFGMEKFEIKKFKTESERWFKDVFKIEIVQRLSSPLTEQLSIIVGIFILWYGGSLVLSEKLLSAESFILFLFCIFSLVRPIKELGGVNNGIQQGLAAADRIFRVLDSHPEITDENGAIEISDIKSRIKFDNVNFSYEKDSPILSNINFDVSRGEVIALVGHSGAGKSTLVDLIPRFYNLDNGSISIDDIDIQKIKLKSLRKLMGIVTQEIILFNDTIKNNIAYGLNDIPDENIIVAAKAANAHKFITKMPEQYDTIIGDRGLKLSGGERQRISIARAILKNPPILIFDEATSSLDTESESLVQDAINNLMKGRTTFVIAHRLSTIKNVDRIIVLDKGEIIQTGKHDELIAQDGLYKNLYELQFNR